MEINFEILENGNLRLSFDDDVEIQEVRESLNKYGSNFVLVSMTEGYWANGWGVFPDADTLGQMSSTPIISEDASVEDDGSNTLFGKCWYFPSYMIYCPIEKIIDDGHVDFSPLWNLEEPENFGIVR